MIPESLPDLKTLLNSQSDINDDGDDSSELLKAGLIAFAAGLASDLSVVRERVDEISNLDDPDEISNAVNLLKSDLPELLKQSIQKPASKTAIKSAIAAGFLNGVNESADSGDHLKSPASFQDVADILKKDGTLPDDDVSKIGSDFEDRADWSSASTKANLINDLIERLDFILAQGDDKELASDIADDLDFDPENPEDGIASKKWVLGTALSIPALAIGFGLLTWGAENPEEAAAWELYREEFRKEPRDWPARWADSGGQFYEDSDSGSADYAEGRMIAPAYDEIFPSISRFGEMYPIYDFNSGMWIRLIPLNDAISLGAVDSGDQPDAPDLDFNSNVQLNGDLDPDIRQTLLESLGADFQYDSTSGMINRGGSITNSYSRVIRQIRNRKETAAAIRNCQPDNPLQREPAWKLMMPRKVRQPFHIANAQPVKSERKPFRVSSRKVMNDCGGLAGGADSPATGSMSSLGSISSKPFIKKFGTRR